VRVCRVPLEQVPEGNDGNEAAADISEPVDDDAGAPAAAAGAPTTTTDAGGDSSDGAALASPRPAEPSQAESSEPAPPAPSGDAPAHNWKEYKTKEGKVYYYDKVSKKTQWTRPAEMDETVRARARICLFVSRLCLTHTTYVYIRA
jgi:hypothetical protein